MLRKHSGICVVLTITCLVVVFRITFDRHPELYDTAPARHVREGLRWKGIYAGSTPPAPSTRNNGSVTLAWNAKWAHNFVNRHELNSIADSQALVMGMHRSDQDYRAHGAYWADRRLDEEERAKTIEGIDRLLKLLPEEWPVSHWEQGRGDTLIKLERLKRCIETDTCNPGETTVILGASPHYGNSKHGWSSGEDIWARSSNDAWEELGHTVIFSYELLEMLDIYQAIGHLIPFISAEVRQVRNCATFGIPYQLRDQDFKDYHGAVELDHDGLMERWKSVGIEVPKEYQEGSGQRWGFRKPLNWAEDHRHQFCVKRKGFEQGIPIWKLMSMKFWAGPDHPLGRAWTLSPEDYGQHPDSHNSAAHNFYLGYSVEKYVRAFNYTGVGEKRDAGFVFAKDLKYFAKGEFAFWNDNHTFADLKAATSLDFIAVAGNKDDHLPDPGLSNHGRLPMEDFYRLMSENKFMMGVGRPSISPTPYDGLALGLPFINPIMDWDRNDPTNRHRWNCQHNGLYNESPPYVYNVYKGDLEGLKEAVLAADANPIEPYTPAHMTPDANRARHQDLVNMNWYALAARQLKHMHDEDPEREPLFIL